MPGLTQPCGCISGSIHPVSISPNSHPWCLSQPHRQNQYQYLTAHIRRCPAFPRLPEQPKIPRQIPAVRSAFPCCWCRCPAGPPGATAGQALSLRKAPVLLLLPRRSSSCRCSVARTLVEQREPLLKQCMSSASYLRAEGEERALTWVVSQLRSRAGKWNYVVLHRRNILWHSQLWFPPCEPGESFMTACIKHKCSLVCFEGGTQGTVYFPVTGSHGNDVPKYLWGQEVG